MQPADQPKRVHVRKTGLAMGTRAPAVAYQLVAVAHCSRWHLMRSFAAAAGSGNWFGLTERHGLDLSKGCESSGDHSE